ncbi:hypothetical protein NOS3756_16470 [Nostoc sp. NIES-3756]|uniref:hypothetical protein n=1 Tax=Nostoc sp. NIES-3756 TaxID=1751286 RepID=UPI000720DF72|nr:hypothetical protein [Nostoc sp. NIES-3756]BAT52706.1 hypothetical protein NOS3756_16470 [Nostoc sp. NIES-3756]
MSFSDVVEAIKSLSFEEKQEIQLLLQQYLREERRQEIYDSYKKAKLEEKNSNLKFTTNIYQLKQMMEDE